MWQLIKDFIFMDALHTICFWSLVGIAVIGFIEIIYRIIQAGIKIGFANDYIKHVENIYVHVSKRLESYNSAYDTSSLNEITADLNFVEINWKKAEECIDVEHYMSSPIYSLHSMLYYGKWDDREAAQFCHQIGVDYEISKNKHQREAKINFILLFVPLIKLYRGFCVLFRLLTFPIKKIFTNFDSSKKWEMSISALIEIIALINVIIEFIKTIS